MNGKIKWSIYVTDSRQTANWIRLKDDRSFAHGQCRFHHFSTKESQLVSISLSNSLMCWIFHHSPRHQLWIQNAFETANVQHFCWKIGGKFTFSGNFNANSFRVFSISFPRCWNFVEILFIHQTVDEMGKVENVRELNL